MCRGHCSAGGVAVWMLNLVKCLGLGGVGGVFDWCQVRMARVLSVMTGCLRKTIVTGRSLTTLRERQFTDDTRTSCN